MQEKPKNNISKDELLDKLEEEFKESEVLQWYIETEIKRLLTKNTSYEDLKKIAKISRDSITKANTNKKKE